MTLLAFPALADVSLDFTSNTGSWMPTSSSTTVSTKTAPNGMELTYYKAYYNTGKYLMVGKKDAYVIVNPKVACTSIIMSPKSGASGNVIIKLFAGDTEIEEKKGNSNGTDITFDLKGTYPIGTKYKFLITNAYNAQFAKLTFVTPAEKTNVSLSWNQVGTDAAPLEVQQGKPLTLKLTTDPETAVDALDGVTITQDPANSLSMSRNGNNFTFTGTAVGTTTLGVNFASDAYNLTTDLANLKNVIKVVDAPAIVPGQVVANPAGTNGTITATKGETVTFSAQDAAQLSVKVGEGTPYLVLNPYDYEVSSDVTVKVVPVDNKGALYENLALTVNIDAVAKVPGQVTANPAGTENKLEAVAGSKVTFSSTDAAKLSVQIGDAAATEQANPYEYTVTEGETTVTVTPIDSDNALHADKALTLTITGTVPQEWVFTNVSGVSDINDGDFVVIVGKGKSDSKYYAMTNAKIGSRIGAKNVTVTDNSITLEKGQAEIAVVKVVKNAEHKVSFKGNNGYVYGGDNTETSWSVGATYGAISDLDNNYSTKGFKYITNGNRWLQLYTTPDFRGYASQSGGYVFLFKCPNYVDKAPEAGEVTFDPASGAVVSRGTEVKMTSANAKQIAYKVTIGETEGETVTVAANASNSATYTITEACTIEAWGINADGVEGTHNTATYTLNVAAPKYVTFSVKEGHYTEEALEVALGVDPDANPACEIFYTLDATKASAEKADGEKMIKYKEPITIKPVEGFQTVTLNVFARNTEGSTVGAATYALGCTKTTDPSLSADKWYRVNSLADLVDGDEVIIVARNHKKAVSTRQKNNNRDAVDVVIDEDGAISTIADDVAKFTISGKPGDWTLATSAWTDKDGKEKASGYMYTSGSTTSIWRTSEDLNSVANATYSFQLDFDVTDNDRMTMRYNVSDSNMNEFVAYNGSGSNTLWSTYVTDYGELNMESYESPSFYKKGGAPRFEIVEDLYLYQEKAEYVDDDAEDFAGYEEAAYRFTYDKANNEYTLTLEGLAGQFWIRDGKANHAGTFFGTDVNVANVADEPAAAPRRVAATTLDANGNKNIAAEEGVWHNLVWRQDQHAKFDTHTYNADGTLASHNAIEAPTITVKYVPGSHTNAVMKISGNNVTTGVEGITNDVNDGEAVYFNMQGLRVNEPQKGGVYVRVQNGKAVNVIRN